MKEKRMIVKEALDINVMGQSYLQLNTNQGTFIIHNKEEGDAFAKKYFASQKKKVKDVS